MSSGPNACAKVLNASMLEFISSWLFFMPLPLPQYINVKDNYCIAYFGNNKEYIVLLKILRPFMEKAFPGIKIFISCKEDLMYLLENEERIIEKEKLKDSRYSFGYVRELLCDMQSHPIEEFMKESDIDYGPISKEKINNSNLCILLTNGIAPVKSLTGNQIKLALEHIKQKNYHVEINGDIKNAGWVIGVENEQLYKAALMGKQITFINTGFGENIFKRLFPETKILNLQA